MKILYKIFTVLGIFASVFMLYIIFANMHEVGLPYIEAFIIWCIVEVITLLGFSFLFYLIANNKLTRKQKILFSIIFSIIVAITFYLGEGNPIVPLAELLFLILIIISIFYNPDNNIENKKAEATPPIRDIQKVLWHVAIDGKQAGPYEEEKIKLLIELGQINMDTLVWKEGMSDWKKINEIEF
jgi:hypothetical protein